MVSQTCQYYNGISLLRGLFVYIFISFCERTVALLKVHTVLVLHRTNQTKTVGYALQVGLGER